MPEESRNIELKTIVEIHALHDMTDMIEGVDLILKLKIQDEPQAD